MNSATEWRFNETVHKLKICALVQERDSLKRWIWEVVTAEPDLVHAECFRVLREEGRRSVHLFALPVQREPRRFASYTTWQLSLRHGSGICAREYGGMPRLSRAVGEKACRSRHWSGGNGRARRCISPVWRPSRTVLPASLICETDPIPDSCQRK